MRKNEQNAKVGKTTLQRQYIFIIIGVIVAALFAIFYFAIYPNLVEKVAGVDYVYNGEYYDGTTLYVTGPYKRADIAKIEIKNSYGIYVLNEKGTGSSKDYTLEGAESVYLDAYSVAGVVVAAGQPITVAADSKHYRADEYATKDDLAKYGLDEASDPSWFRVTLTDGSSYRIFIGDKIPTGTNRYAYIEDEARMNVVKNEDGTTSSYYIVYVLDPTTTASLLYGKTSLVSPIVGQYCGNGAYYLTNFELHRFVDGERELIVQITDNDNTESATSSAFELKYPRGYMLNDTEFQNTVLSVLAYIEAEEVVALGDEIFTPEVYEKYGLDIDKDRIADGTDKNYIKMSYACLDSNSEDYENTIYISEKQLLADGSSCYYVYSPDDQTITKVAEETLEFASWTAASFTSARLFFESIGSLDYFSILSSDKKVDARFTLTGSSLTYHVEATDASGNTPLKTKDGEDLIFDVEYERTKYDTTYTGEFENFRDLYYVLITRMLDIEEDPVIISNAVSPVCLIEAQVKTRDKSSQYYKYDGNTKVVEDSSYVTVLYSGGYLVVSNLEGYIGNTKVTYDKAYYDEKTGKYFVKAVDTADSETKPRNYKYSENEQGQTTLVPIFLDLKDATSEYTVTKYEYEFYDIYDEVTNADGTVSKVLNQTYMLVVPNATEMTYRINSDGSEELIAEDRLEIDEKVGSYIRRASVDKLLSDTTKVLAGESIDKWAVD